MTPTTLIIVVSMALSACWQSDPVACTGGDSFLITNVVIIDGSGSPATSGSVRISGGLIADVGELAPCAAEQIVDGDGQTLAPGFIDTHSHADNDIFERPDALSLVSQGITTIVVGQDGSSPLPIADFYAQLELVPATVNVAAYAGHNTLRERVMQDEFRREATAEEIDQMKRLLAAELESGALGLSTGLEYEPGIYSSSEEVLALAHVAAAVGGRYISHVRSEDRWFEDALDEAFFIGRETGMPVQISHLKLAMRRLLNRADEFVAKLDAARDQGINISADIYPYEYWQSTMMVLLPERDPEDLDAIAEALDQIAPPDGIWMARFAPNPDYIGKTLSDIAALRETDPVTAFSELAVEALAWEQETGESAESIIGTSMLQSDVGKLMQWPFANICTDGSIVGRHPRGVGSFPRVLGRYTRELGLFPIEEAVRKMSSLAANNMGMSTRGLIREGLVADLVLFDPDTVMDHATPLDPLRLSSGISRVWVSGELVFNNGEVTAARPGKVIRRD